VRLKYLAEILPLNYVSAVEDIFYGRRVDVDIENRQNLFLYLLGLGLGLGLESGSGLWQEGGCRHREQIESFFTPVRVRVRVRVMVMAGGWMSTSRTDRFFSYTC
jgi:hypothetical protein